MKGIANCFSHCKNKQTMKMRKILLSVLCCFAILANAQTSVFECTPVKRAMGKAPVVAQKATTKSLKTRKQNAALAAAFGVDGKGGDKVVWSEGFDNGLGEWTVAGSDDVDCYVKANGTGHCFTEIDPKSTGSLYMEGPYQYYKRGLKSATSPEISVPKNGKLTFYVGYSQNYDDDCRLGLSVSADDFATGTELWNSKDETGELPWRWHKVEVSMEAYAGSSVKLRFNYLPGKGDTFQTGGYMGDYFIDGLSLSAPEAVSSISVKTGEKVRFVDLSTGNPTSWLWTFEGGTPRTSTSQSPEVYYTEDGSFSVTLSISDGSNADELRLNDYVSVTGDAPVAHILPPATFRNAETHLPMVAPLVKVRYEDASENFPTSWGWAFSGVDEDKSKTYETMEQNPEVGYMFLHQQNVALAVANSHGSSTDQASVSVEYQGGINNILSSDKPANFDMDDWGEFPGTNKKITKYAEKFSRPSRPMLMYGAYVYFTKAEAKHIADQIAPIAVSLYTSENGVPGRCVDTSFWEVFNLDTPTADGSLQGTAFEFTRPQIVDDEFFVVVDGFPEKNDSVQVSFAMADFRHGNNTAYMFKDQQWQTVESYFGPDRATSFYITPVIAHSVISALPNSRGDVTVQKEQGTVDYPLFSYLGYDKAVKSSAPWCSVVSQPNGMTVDTLKIAYEALPEGMDEREAVLTLTDSVSLYDIHVIQRRNGATGISSVLTDMSQGSVVSKVFDDVLSVNLNEAARVEVYSAGGKAMFCREYARQVQAAIPANAWQKGVYIVKITTGGGTVIEKCLKK